MIIEDQIARVFIRSGVLLARSLDRDLVSVEAGRYQFNVEFRGLTSLPVIQAALDRDLVGARRELNFIISLKHEPACYGVESSSLANAIEARWAT